MDTSRRTKVNIISFSSYRRLDNPMVETFGMRREVLGSKLTGDRQVMEHVPKKEEKKHLILLKKVIFPSAFLKQLALSIQQPKIHRKQNHAPCSLQSFSPNSHVLIQICLEHWDVNNFVLHDLFKCFPGVLYACISSTVQLTNNEQIHNKSYLDLLQWHLQGPVFQFPPLKE